MNRRPASAPLLLLLGVLLLAAPAREASAQAQANAGDLVGSISDPHGARVVGAVVSARNLSTNVVRTTTTDNLGEYRLLVLPPGSYEVTIEAPGFASMRNPSVEVRVGERALYEVTLELRRGEETLVVTSEPQLVEPQRTAVADTITSRQIENLPINQRDYLNFTLLTSSAARDNAPALGPAPTSGLNFAGQRARFNQISIDGADATDKIVHGVRSTVPQESVQEFQIVTNSFLPEFGRALGGVVNIVTKSGGNDLHGNLFGFIRNRRFEARNPFSTEEDPAFTRFQGGATLGGPLRKDRTFFFFAYETRRRQESGFSSIGADNFGLVPFATPLGDLLVTSEQSAFLNDPTAQAILGPIDFGDGFPNTPLENYLFLAAGASGVAVNGVHPFLGAPVFAVPPFFPLPPSFTLLNVLGGNYPVSEGTSFWSGRIDHTWNANNTSFLRVNVTPSTLDGIQVNAQNQTFGQNAWSRTSAQSFRDLAVVFQNVTTIGTNWVNEARFQFARRGYSFTPSIAPGRPGEPLGGEGLGVNIRGVAFFGREPLSRADRVERRLQWTDNVSYIRGTHTFKFGTDINLVQFRPRFANKQVFELNFGGVMDFGALSETAFGFPDTAGPVDIPGFSAVQAYGLGLPQSLTQGIGDSSSSFDDTGLAFYFQDTWRIRPNLTLNYGLRWEGEFTPLLEPFNELTARAEAALGVVEGFPRDWNNVQPRIGLAWDPWGTGKTMVRAAYGIFFDHPNLASAFLSDTNDGSQSSQQILFGGAPCATSILADLSCLNAASVFQGVLNAPDLGPFTFGYLPTQQRFDPFAPNSIFINQNFCPQPSGDPARQCAGFPLPFLPVTIPVVEDFVSGYAQHWNFSIERELATHLALTVSYVGVKGTNLHRPRNINAADPALLVQNFVNALATDPMAFGGGTPLAPGTDPRLVQVPVVDPGVCGALFIPGIFCLTNTGVAIASPAAFNFFRPSGPNFAFTGGVGVPDAAILAAAQAGGYPQGPGFFVPFSDLFAQESTGSSIYHGLRVDLRKRFSRHYQLLASYTWSHAIDDATDIGGLSNPQDNRNPGLERANSTFDLRHRFVFSGVFESPFNRQDSSVWRKVLADFTLAPIFEASSGRPFTVLTGTDANLDFWPATDRPTVVPEGTPGSVTSPFLKGVAFLPPTQCPASSTPETLFFGCTGNVGRNTFTRPSVWNLDFRVARKFYLGERWTVDVLTDVFNVFNRFNVADVNALCDPIGGSCIAGQPTAALDSRQFQFGVKVNW